MEGKAMETNNSKRFLMAAYGAAAPEILTFRAAIKGRFLLGECEVL